MKEFKVKVLSTEQITHDVKRITLARPAGYTFKPGQATEVAVNKPGWENKKRPFTFTSLPSWKDLEFTIKIYNDHHGVTEQIGKLEPGDELILHDSWGAIAYKGTGVFIAGGAGITPFISILRELEKDDLLKGNKLIFSNRSTDDIIMKNEFSEMLGSDFINVITRENTSEYHNKRIDHEFLKSKISDFSQHFYVCGPEPFVSGLNQTLLTLGASPEAVVFEK